MNNTTNNSSRREILAKAGIVGAGAAAFLLAAQSGQAQPAATKKEPMTDGKMAPDEMADGKMMDGKMAPKMMAPSGDLDIVRFALTMEQLEAAFYAQIVTAHQNRVYLPARAFQLAQQIALAEADHVRALSGVLAGAEQAVPAAPTFQFPAQVFLSPITFAWFAYTLEEIGIGAYLGAVGNIESDDIRQAAASIYGAEAQHAALLRTFAGFNFAPRYYESPLSVDQVTTLITPYIMA